MILEGAAPGSLGVEAIASKSCLETV